MIGKGAINLGVELADDFGRDILGGTDTVPLAPVVARYKFAYGRHVGQYWRAPRRCNRKSAKLAVADELVQRGYGPEHNLRLSAEKIGNIAAAVRNVNPFYTGHHFEEFAEDMRH